MLLKKVMEHLLGHGHQFQVSQKKGGGTCLRLYRVCEQISSACAHVFLYCSSVNSQMHFAHGM